MALMWTPTRAFRFFDSKPKWHKLYKSMRNQWAHQSQNENLFSQFLARKKKKRCKFLVSTGVMLIPGFMEGLLSQNQHSGHAVMSPPNGAGFYPTSLDKRLSSPSFTSSPDPRCITYKRHCWIPCPSPQNEHGKAWRASKENDGRDLRTQKPVSSCKAQRPLSV